MATKKFKCKVCGYIHEGDAAPEKCPVCQAPASEFEEIVEAGGTEKPAKKGLNTDGNTYTIIYSCIVVVIVAFLLAFVSKVLEPQSMANVRIDKKSQILAALNLRDVEKTEVEKTYDEVVVADEIIDQGRQRGERRCFQGCGRFCRRRQKHLGQQPPAVRM